MYSFDSFLKRSQSIWVCLNPVGLTNTIEAFFLFALPGTTISIQQVPIITFLLQAPKRATARCIITTFDSTLLCSCPVMSEDPLSWFYFHRSSSKGRITHRIRQRRENTLPGDKERLKSQHQAADMIVL